jgi:hypothetical protein
MGVNWSQVRRITLQALGRMETDSVGKIIGQVLANDPGASGRRETHKLDSFLNDNNVKAWNLPNQTKGSFPKVFSDANREPISPQRTVERALSSSKETKASIDCLFEVGHTKDRSTMSPWDNCGPDCSECNRDWFLNPKLKIPKGDGVCRKVSVSGLRFKNPKAGFFKIYVKEKEWTEQWWGFKTQEYPSKVLSVFDLLT